MLPPEPPRVRHRVGVDLVEIDRVERLLREEPEIADRIFTPRELSYCRGFSHAAAHLAARFAGKEAVLKVLGLPPDADLTDVEISLEESGRPTVRLHGPLSNLARPGELLEIELSLSHTGAMAAALALAVWSSSEA